MRLHVTLGTSLLLLVACTDGSEQTPDGAGPQTVDPATGPTPQAAAGGPSIVAVQVGGDSETDACSLGGVTADAQAAGRKIAVRSGPSTRHAVVDSIAPTQTFSSCDDTEGWVGIVYQKEGDPASPSDCGGLSSPIAEKRVYRGPCRSGWIPAAVHEILAG